MTKIEITDQKHPSNIAQFMRDQIIKCTEKIVWISELDEQNLKVYNMLSEKIEALNKKLDDYHSKYNSLRKTVKRLERDVGTQKNKLEDLNEYVNRDTVVNLIYEVLSMFINKKGKSSFYSFDTSDSSEKFDLVKMRY
ncbi:hypothetical protein C2G38_2032004 [Gigaspora rosea]|uniref:Uncharacterized protein n=1 Tax=Gigaspora rosea TaxID=44941 RepID=A0A397VSI9_9GLOM|nr:hypothetical protein C2G38_2032004 [Gigaspora rosea]